MQLDILFFFKYPISKDVISLLVKIRRPTCQFEVNLWLKLLKNIHFNYLNLRLLM